MSYNVTVANNYGFLTAKNNGLILEIDMVNNCISYNGMIIRLSDYANNEPNLDLMYLACALRKTIFDDANLKGQLATTLTSLRIITASCPIPTDLKISLNMF